MGATLKIDLKNARNYMKAYPICKRKPTEAIWQDGAIMVACDTCRGTKDVWPVGLIEYNNDPPINNIHVAMWHVREKWNRSCRDIKKGLVTPTSS